MKLDAEIDRLYQLSLKEFTPARNALAKQVRGADATRVRALQKPNVAAWAINQLYWRNRDVYDRLIASAERLRTAHRGLLAGKSTDLHKAEAEHRDAVRAAMQEIRRVLADAGESASTATMTAASETLDAMPAPDESPGRLTRPLKRMGFEALSGVAPRPAGAPPPKLALVKGRDKKPPEPEISAARKREIDEVETRLRTAQTDERQTKAEIERMRRELERAEREHGRAEQELREASAKVKRFKDDLTAREKAQRARAAEQEKLERRLETLRPVEHGADR